MTCCFGEGCVHTHTHTHTQQEEITVDTVLESLKAMQEQLREKNQKYNEMKQRFETSNEVIS